MASVTGLTADKTYELIDSMVNQVPNLPETNLNNLTAPFSGTGMFRAPTETENKPPEASSGAAFVRSIRMTSAIGVQWWIETPWNNNIKVWERSQYNGTWSSWVRSDASALRDFAMNDQTIPTLQDTDLDTFTAPFSGSGRWRASASQGVTNFPPELSGGGAYFWQHRFTSQDGIQRWITSQSEWERTQISGVWSPWIRIEKGAWSKNILDDGVGLNDVLDPGAYRITAGRTHANSAFPSPGTSYVLEVLEMGTSWHFQRATDQYGNVKVRSGVGSSGINWGGWRDFPETSGGGSGGASLTGGLSRTAMETTGYWTSLSDEAAYLTNLNVHRGVEILNIGKSVSNKDMKAIRIGNPNKPAVLFVAEQHGNEPGGREGLLIFARELLTNPKNMALPDMCVLIVPTANPDGFNQTRNNANGVNLNRDWIARAEPETQAIASLLTNHNVVAVLDIHNFGYIHDVSMRASRKGTAPVINAAEGTFDALFAAYQDAGQAVRMYGEPEDPVTDGSLANEMGGIEGIPGLLLEIPYHRELTNFYTPEPAWHAKMALLGSETFLDHVWRNLDAFVNL